MTESRRQEQERCIVSEYTASGYVTSIFNQIEIPDTAQRLLPGSRAASFSLLRRKSAVVGVTRQDYDERIITRSRVFGISTPCTYMLGRDGDDEMLAHGGQGYDCGVQWLKATPSRKRLLKGADEPMAAKADKPLLEIA